MKQFDNNEINKKIIKAKNKLKNLSLDYKKNVDYAKKQAVNFLKGKSPPDFVTEDYEVDYKGRATIDDLTELGKQQMAL